jgi:hypothetical protein
MPKWIDIYALRGRHYRLENDAFPQAYREVTQRVREAFDQYPNDQVIHEYLGCLSEIAGHRKAALTRYRYVDRERHKMLTQETDLDGRAELRQDIHRLQLRIAALRRRQSV